MGKNIVTFGEMMLRLSTIGALRIPQSKEMLTSFGGSEANVAVSLANFGHEVQYVSCVPKNDIGRASLMTLHQYNVHTDYVAQGGDRMGSYYMETAASMRSSKVVYDREDSAYSKVQPYMVDWKQAFSSAFWFHWSGIAAAISNSAAETCIAGVKQALKSNIHISFDLNYRKNLWHYGKTYEEIVRPLINYSEVVFGSEDEFEHVLGMSAGSFRGVRITSKGYEIDKDLCTRVMTEAKKRYPDVKIFSCEMRAIVSSNHHVNAAVIYDGEKIYFSHIYDVDNVVDAVGVGDAYCAALIDGIIVYKDAKQAMEFAMAASALKNTLQGDFNLVSRDEVLSLLSGNVSGRIQR